VGGIESKDVDFLIELAGAFGGGFGADSDGEHEVNGGVFAFPVGRVAGRAGDREGWREGGKGEITAVKPANRVALRREEGGREGGREGETQTRRTSDTTPAYSEYIPSKYPSPPQ